MAGPFCSRARALIFLLLAPSLFAWVPSEALKQNVRSWMVHAGKTPLQDPAIESYNHDTAGNSLRTLAAGLVALKELSSSDTLKPSLSFKKQGEDWIKTQVKQFAGAGTTSNHGERDYDFLLVQWAHFLWAFANEPTLVSTDALDHIVFQGKNTPPYSGNKKLPLLIFRVDIKVGSLSFPETENHVLMTAAWNYLVNQYIDQNPRKSPRLDSLKNAHPKGTFQNRHSHFEDQLLAVLGRIPQSGYFETNSRAYQSFSVLALQALASYAEHGPVRRAAQIALEYTLLKTSYQSIDARRYPPSRRNWEYRTRWGLLQNDYLPYIFAHYGAPHTFDFDPSCTAKSCAYKSAQIRGFSFWTLLSTWRPPEILTKIMKEPVRENFYHFTRAQARFSHRHYLQGKWPRYAVHPRSGKNSLQQPDLRNEKIIPTPEFYFGNRDFLFSSGGVYTPYPGMNYLKIADKHEVYTFFTKPSILLFPELDFSSLENARQKTLLALENPDTPYESSNSGLFRNILFATTQNVRYKPFTIPQSWISQKSRVRENETWYEIYEFGHGPSTLRNYFAVSVEGTMKKGEARRALLEWIPKELFEGSFGALVEKIKEAPPLLDFKNPRWEWRSLSNGLLLKTDPYPHPRIAAINDQAEEAHEQHWNPVENQNLPLLEVKELNSKFQETGYKYIEADGTGKIIYRHPSHPKVRVLDAQNYQKPTISEISPF